MFSRHGSNLIDFSTEIRDVSDWSVGILKRLENLDNVSTIAVDPILGLLAVGTLDGIVRIFGGPGVDIKLSLPQSIGIRSLFFVTSLLRIVCLDDDHQLHIWDLSADHGPKYLTSAKFDPTTLIVASPSHYHAFVGLESGDIRTYDVACLRKSPYIVSNMWALYESKQHLDQGSTTLISRIPVEVLIHPRDINLLLIAYGGGVVLCDLTQRSAIREYEMTIPGGAPGSGGYDSEDLFTHRKPEVTSIAMHPAGHFFVVGHIDGSLAFWAVEDEDKPLLVRTLDVLDINVVDGSALEEHMESSGGKQAGSKAPVREPIFKLSWSSFPNSSDPRGGETALAILGGQYSGDAPGVTVHWLPAFHPADPPAATSPSATNFLHQSLRDAMRNSCSPSQTYFYATQNVALDFFLIPRQTPHFAGSYDPYAILMLTVSAGEARVLEGHQFPPSSFVSETAAKPQTSLPSPGPETSSIVDELAETLDSLKVADDPRRLRLPGPLWNGSTGLQDGLLLAFDRFTHQSLRGDGATPIDPKLLLKGGSAYADDNFVSELKLAKHESRRFIITSHEDLTIQFYDISVQLLLNTMPSPIEADFPEPIPALTIDLDVLFVDPSVLNKTSPSFVNNAAVDSVELSKESLECAVTFKTGELVVYHLRPPPGHTPLVREPPNKELTSLTHLSTGDDRRFLPWFMLAPGKGPVQAFALSDIGFLAASYPDGSMFIIDMRGPNIVYRYGLDKKAKGRHSLGLITRSETIDPITSLVWTVCSVAKDHQPKVQLIAVHVSGQCQVFSITREKANWVVAEPLPTEGAAAPFMRGTFVLDGKTGAEIRADKGHLSLALQQQPDDLGHAVLVVTGQKGARCIQDLNGERLGRADWGSKHGNVQNAQIVEKMGSCTLVAFTDRFVVLVYSLPGLEFLHTLELPKSLSLPLSVDETGDFISLARNIKSKSIKTITYGSLFNIRRAFSPLVIELDPTLSSVPPQPQPVSVGPTSILSSWLTSGRSVTGDQLDALLGGPDRPAPPIKAKDRVKEVVNPQAAKGETSGATSPGLAASVAATQSTVYNRLASALSERGRMLGDLEQSFNNLGEGSKNMAAQAKRLAAQQSAKTWFGF